MSCQTDPVYSVNAVLDPNSVNLCIKNTGSKKDYMDVTSINSYCKTIRFSGKHLCLVEAGCKMRINWEMDSALRASKKLVGS